MTESPEEAELNVPSTPNTKGKFLNVKMVLKNSDCDQEDHLGAFGTEEDLMLASEKAHNLKVYAAFRPPDTQFVLYSAWMMICPCFWPFAPCICPLILNSQEKMKFTLYIVTEKSIIVSVTDHSKVCCPWCQTGDGFEEFLLDSISSVVVNNKEKSGGRFSESSVIIYFEAGNRRGGKGGRGGRGGKVLNMFVQEAEQIAILIQLLKDKTQASITQQLLAQQPQPTKRIFVSKFGSDDVSLVILNGNSQDDWEQFLENVRKEFDFVEESAIKISLAEANVAITQADQLQANDKVVVDEA